MENEQVHIKQLIKMLQTLYRDGSAYMVLPQVGAAPDLKPRRDPPSTTDGDSVHGRASIRQSKATGHKDSTDTLRVMQWNAEGIYKKKLELTNFLRDNTIDILCAQEIHLNKENILFMRGYQTFRVYREGHKGGLITLVRNNIAATETSNNLDESEHITIKIHIDTAMSITNFY